MRYLATWFALTSASTAMYLMYLDGQHNVVPDAELVSDVSYVALAFLKAATFTSAVQPNPWPLFTSVAEVRMKFPQDTKVIVSIGGWGDSEGWPDAAADDTSRKQFAQNVATMVDDTGADGVDIDWEYPGGNGEDYKRNPNDERVWEIEAYPKLLAEIRAALGANKIMSAAVPGLRRDMLAFTSQTMPQIMESLDFLNVMTFDLMNRRDNVTRHHTGIKASIDSVDAYLDMGIPSAKINLGFAFYVKWFQTQPGANCQENPVGCKTVLMEDPQTGEDLNKAGAFSWHDRVPEELEESFAKALRYGTFDSEGGGHFYWDWDEDRFWTWDTPEVIAKKIPQIIEKKQLGGVFAWSLGEDAEEFKHFKALTAALKQQSRLIKEEL
ncbi:MAG: hypothetical protein M1822_005966 [Bathelium mastoideum]|nr:MAG: hypothetical protein M1822_005966 [Bathelium mastoideum]